MDNLEQRTSPKGGEAPEKIQTKSEKVILIKLSVQ